MPITNTRDSEKASSEPAHAFVYKVEHKYKYYRYRFYYDKYIQSLVCLFDARVLIFEARAFLCAHFLYIVYALIKKRLQSIVVRFKFLYLLGVLSIYPIGILLLGGLVSFKLPFVLGVYYFYFI